MADSLLSSINGQSSSNNNSNHMNGSNNSNSTHKNESDELLSDFSDDETANMDLE